MQFIFSAIMGLVQGLSEFLPISSSGHLLLTQNLLALIGYNVESAKSLMIMLHMGTLIAVLAVFWKDFLHTLLHPVKDKTLFYLLIASLPALFAMLLAGDFIEGAFTGWFLAPAFLVTALFLYLAERFSRAAGRHRKAEVQERQALAMGGFQAIALLPGVSRSGSTLLGGVLSGLSRHNAARFSFMMSAPAILGSFLTDAYHAHKEGALSSLFSADILVGVVFAAVSGYFAIRFMLRLIERISLTKFSLYLIGVAVLVLALQLTHVPGFPPLFGAAAVQPIG